MIDQCFIQVLLHILMKKNNLLKNNLKIYLIILDNLMKKLYMVKVLFILEMVVSFLVCLFKMKLILIILDH